MLRFDRGCVQRFAGVVEWFRQQVERHCRRWSPSYDAYENYEVLLATGTKKGHYDSQPR